MTTYPAMIHELAEAMRHVLQAQEWATDSNPNHTPGDRVRNEYGNIQTAATHVRNVYTSLARREEQLVVDVRLSEKAGMKELADVLARGGEVALADDVAKAQAAEAAKAAAPLTLPTSHED